MAGWRAAVAAAAIAGSVFAQPAPRVRTTERAVFFSGEVTLADGTLPPDPVLIQRVCKGVARDETWTDADGRFGFKVGASGDESATPDAAAATPDTNLSRPIGNSTYYTNPVTAALRDCEVQAVLAGFSSDRVSIALKNTLDNTQLGRIVLHPLSRGQALTVSMVTLAAPGNAKTAYAKGMAEIRERHWDAAEREFKRAVATYPKFAAAWFEAGLLCERNHDNAGAEKAWSQALASDPKYVRPYEGLTALAERQQNWTASERYSRAWIQLDPDDFPAAYLYNAVANAQMNKVAEAEHAAREGLRIDKQHQVPRLSYVLGLLLMRKHDNGEAAKCLRTYVELAPDAKDAALVRGEIAKLEAAAK